jgi:hypothetical protein
MEVAVAVISRKVDLERRTDKRFLVSKELQHLGIVLSTTTNQVHRLAVCAAKLDFFATVIETRAIFL